MNGLTDATPFRARWLEKIRSAWKERERESNGGYLVLKVIVRNKLDWVSFLLFLRSSAHRVWRGAGRLGRHAHTHIRLSPQRIVPMYFRQCTAAV